MSSVEALSAGLIFIILLRKEANSSLASWFRPGMNPSDARGGPFPGRQSLGLPSSSKMLQTTSGLPFSSNSFGNGPKRSTISATCSFSS